MHSFFNNVELLLFLYNISMINVVIKNVESSPDLAIPNQRKAGESRLVHKKTQKSYVLLRDHQQISLLM